MKKIQLILGGLLLAITLLNGQNNFPIDLPLTSSEGLSLLKNNGTGKELPYFDENGMTMTVDRGNIYTGAYFSELSFSIERGFVIEFEYEVFTKMMINPIGDGFALVLFDGSIGEPTLGYSGSALGYTYNRSRDNSINKAGLSGGFLGIGFDSYGHFHLQGTDKDGDWRTGKFPSGSLYRDFVSIRGPVNSKLDDTYGVNKAGYPVLIAQNVHSGYYNDSIMFYSELVPNWVDSNPSSAYSNSKNIFKSFTIAGNKEGAAYPSSYYRKAIVEMIPDKDSPGVFYVSVSIVIDDITKARKVIKNYKIDTNGTIKYPEVIVPSGYLVVTASNSSVPQVMSMKAPSRFKMGWTAATGKNYGYTIIKNASVTLPYVPIIVNDNFDICGNKGSYSDFNPIANDYGYDISLANPTPDNAFIDKKSFRFMVPAAKGTVGFVENDPAHPYVMDKNDIKYTYDPETGIVKSEPKVRIALDSSDVLYYNITNLNAVDDEYRSKVGTINLKFTEDKCEIVNTGWIKINSTRNRSNDNILINGMENVPPRN